MSRLADASTGPRGGSRDPELRLLATTFFDDWMAAEPEEATSLGLPGAAPHLRDPSPAAEESAARRGAATLRALDAIEARGGLDVEDRRDAWAIRAHATEQVLAGARSRSRTTLEAVPYAIAMLAHEAARCSAPEARAALGDRIAALPAYVEAARSALRGGLADGLPFSSAIAAVVAGQLDGALDDLRAIVATSHATAPQATTRSPAEDAIEPAARAVRSFAAFLREEVATAVSAVDVVPLGEAEVDRRLRAWWHLDAPRSALATCAREELARAREDVVTLAARLAPGLDAVPARVASFADAKLVLDHVLAGRADSSEAIVARYEQEIARATAFCRERGTFSIPAACDCPVVRAPELWRRFAACTNWPAPLLGGEAPGACAVVADPALHALVNVPSLAVHEAIPGHFLQSRAWQLRFGATRAPVRFLGVPDECGLLRDAWIPHLMIEGWAVYAEARMEEAGFHDAAGALFCAFCRAIRAARVLADLGLHTEGWSREHVASFVADATGMPPAFCAGQGLRHARSGMQGLGYLVGQLGIEDLRRRERERHGDRFDELAFQDALLDAGPLPPALLATEGGLATPLARPSTRRPA